MLFFLVHRAIFHNCSARWTSAEATPLNRLAKAVLPWSNLTLIQPVEGALLVPCMSNKRSLVLTPFRRSTNRACSTIASRRTTSLRIRIHLHSLSSTLRITDRIRRHRLSRREARVLRILRASVNILIHRRCLSTRRRVSSCMRCIPPTRQRYVFSRVS